jgi:hypothetical protein
MSASVWDTCVGSDDSGAGADGATVDVVECFGDESSEWAALMA